MQSSEHRLCISHRYFGRLYFRKDFLAMSDELSKGPEKCKIKLVFGSMLNLDNAKSFWQSCHLSRWQKFLTTAILVITAMQLLYWRKLAQTKHRFTSCRVRGCKDATFSFEGKLQKKLKIQLLCTKVLLPFKTWGEIIHVELFVSRITILCTLSKSPIDEKEFDMC